MQRETNPTQICRMSDGDEDSENKEKNTFSRSCNIRINIRGHMCHMWAFQFTFRSLLFIVPTSNTCFARIFRLPFVPLLSFVFVCAHLWCAPIMRTIQMRHSVRSKMNSERKSNHLTDFHSLNFQNIYLLVRRSVSSSFFRSLRLWVCEWKIECSIVENSYNTIVEGVFNDLRLWQRTKLIWMRTTALFLLGFTSFRFITFRHHFGHQQFDRYSLWSKSAQTHSTNIHNEAERERERMPNWKLLHWGSYRFWRPKRYRVGYFCKIIHSHRWIVNWECLCGRCCCNFDFGNFYASIHSWPSFRLKVVKIIKSDQRSNSYQSIRKRPPVQFNTLSYGWFISRLLDYFD